MAEVGAVTFPTTDLRQSVMIALTPDYGLPYWQWGWADITDYVRWVPGISVTSGRRDESGTVNTLDASAVLDNRDGRFSRGYATGPYYGYLTRNTPVWAQVNPGDGWHTRLMGYINAWPKRWDTTGNDATVPVSIGGVMRRVQQTNATASALERTVAGVALGGYTPHAYWPMEDGANATRFASGLADGDPMILGGSITLGTSESIPGSRPLPVWQSGSNAAGIVPSYTDTGLWVAQAAVYVPSGTTSTVTVMTANVAGGTVATASVGVDPSADNLILLTRDSSGTATNIWTASYTSALVEGQPVSVSMSVQDNASGTDERWSAYLIDDEGTVIASISELVAAGTYGRITRVTVNGVAALASDVVIGHVGVFVDSRFTIGSGELANARAVGAWNGEQAHERLKRLCREAGVPFSCLASISAALGPQQPGSLIDVLRDAEKADRGVLYEHEFGFGYKALSEYYNQSTHLALDQAQGHLAETIEADDDDQRFVNQFTARRTDGSWATYRDPDYASGDALVANEDTFDVETDDQLIHIAGWEVNKGIADDDRWPQISINLAHDPGLIGDWVGMPFGGRITVDNPFSQAGVEEIDVIREGEREHWNSKQWSADLNLSPASVYTVGVWDASGSRWSSTSTTLDAALTDSAMSFTATESDGPGWITGSASPNFPFDLDLAGERVRVTEIASGGGGSYTFTVTRSINSVTKSHTAGTQVKLWSPMRWAL